MDRVNTYSSVKRAILHQPNTLNCNKPKDRLFQRINTVYYAALISPTRGTWLPYLHKPVQLHIMTSFLTNYIVCKLEHYKLCPFDTATTTNLLFYLNIMVTTSIRITSPGLIPAILAALAYSYVKQYNINTIISIEPIITGICTLYFYPDLLSKCWSIYQIITCPFISALFQTDSPVDQVAVDNALIQIANKQSDTTPRKIVCKALATEAVAAIAAKRKKRAQECVYQYFKHHGCTHPDKDFYIQPLAERFSTIYAYISDMDEPSEIGPFIQDGKKLALAAPIPIVLRNLCIHVSKLTDCIDNITLHIDVCKLFGTMFEIAEDLLFVVGKIIKGCIYLVSLILFSPSILDAYDNLTHSYFDKYENSSCEQHKNYRERIKLCNN